MKITYLKAGAPVYWFTLGLTVLLTSGCASGPGASAANSAGLPPSQADEVAKLQIVDCLLPGQLRKLGNNSYLTPRRPIKTTAADCNVRGGEYVAYDRADYKTALKVWLTAAEAGDAEAQVNVGEIFEKGLGAEPNYEAAVIWYQKAADQGNKQGLFNLGTMYEQGHGVPADRVHALNLYRQAWGLPEDSVIFQETARAERAALEQKLNQQLAQKNAQVRLLEKQIGSLQKNVKASSRKAQASSAANSSLNNEIATLKQLVDSLNQSSKKVKQELAELPPAQPVQSVASTGVKIRSPDAATSASKTPDSGNVTRVGDLNFGKYYALIIGNRSYTQMQVLDTPVNDAREIAGLLKDKYGFHVQLLIDSDRLTIMKTINDLHGKLGENDNLLVYYAGHGSLLDVGKHETGYWLPVNADPPPDDSLWVPNAFITGHIGRLKAKRVLVIADSCYGGLLSSAPGFLMLGKNAGHVSDEYIKYKLPRRSRLLIASGGDQPVADSVAGGRHSIFTGELIKALRQNNDVLTVPELFSKVEKSVHARSLASNFPQTPILKSIKGAGHEVGDFFFVPRNTATPVAMR